MILLLQPPSEGEWETLEADLTGRLEIEDDCLRVVSSETSGHTPIWPAGHDVREGAEGYELMRPGGGVIAATGDRIEISGGEVWRAEQLPEAVREEARRCPAPYWIVGTRIVRSDES